MTNKEFEKVVEHYHKKGLSDDEIAEAIAKMFVAQRISRQDMNAMLALLGFYPDEESEKLSDEEFRRALDESFR